MTGPSTLPFLNLECFASADSHHFGTEKAGQTDQLRQVLLHTISFMSTFLYSMKSNMASSLGSMLDIFSVCIFTMHLKV